MMLIKFCTNNNYLINSLKKSELFFNNVFKFNDPFEGTFRYKFWSDESNFINFVNKYFPSDIKNLEHLIKHKGELEDKFNKTFEYRHRNNAVCCFSEYKNLTNILMWAHYANNHNGVCLVYDSNLLNLRPGKIIFENSLNQKKMISSPTGPFKVVYKDQYIDTDPEKGELNQETFLTTKFKIWSDEREYRFISPTIGLYQYEQIALQQIVFGFRTHPKFKVQVKNIIDAAGAKVKFSQIKLKENNFAFDIQPELF